MARKKPQKSKPSKSRSSRKIHDAFQIAQRQESRNSKGGDDSDSENEVFDGVMDASKFLNRDQEEFEDEELDSDEALGSDDDYDVLNSKFSQTIRDKAKARKVRKGGMESDDEEDFSSVDEEQWVTLSQAWDMDEAEVNRDFESPRGEEKEVANDERGIVLNNESDEAEESDEESEDILAELSLEEEDIFEGFDEGNDSDTMLTNTLANVTSKLKQPSAQRRRLAEEPREADVFSVPSGGQKLSLNDMLAAVDSSVSKDAILIDEPHAEMESKALDTPLPVNIQKRHDRRAAYEIANEEVSKWDDTVQQNRRAEVLKFPMNAPVKHNESAMVSSNDSQPSTELERKVQDLLAQSALLDDTKEATFEELAAAKLDPAELKRRTNELRLMRELMFREEKRAKRIKKIKSKSYRRVHKKERLKNQELVEGSDDEDPDLQRSRERMTLKHKTQSLWAKSMIKSGLSKDADNRAELEAMLRQGEKLRAKQLGHEDGDQSDEGISDLENDSGNESDGNRSKLGKGVLAMDFMREAEARKKRENREAIAEIRKTEDGLNDLSEDETALSVQKNQGRRVYTPAAGSASEANRVINEKLRLEIADDRAKSLESRLRNDKKVADAELPAPEQELSNPWLGGSDTHAKSSKITAVERDSSKQAKAAHKISKHSKAKKAGPERLIDTGDIIQVVTESGDFDDAENHMFEQRDLIKEAFAGDDVVLEFKAEKRKVAREEDDKVEDVTLPGWGDWAGAGKKRKKNKVVRTIDGVVQKDKRQDRTKKNVIINERVNKKNLKYQSSGVPFPFESREQYERSLRMPVGQEWTSRETHQKLTMPRVIVKQGTVIDPLRAPFK